MRLNLLALLSIPLLTIACGDEDKESGDDGGDSGTADLPDYCDASTSSVDENFCTLINEINTDVTLTTDYTYGVRSGIFVGDGTTNNTITIEPGVQLLGEGTGFLAIQRNASINAVGSAEQPIVFTSGQLEGERGRSDWGGLIINGNAPINNCYTPEGGEVADCEATGEGDTGNYGGTDAGDSSGSLRYVRVEFGGTEISPTNEVNGIAFQGVGSGTSVSYLQVHMNKDDGVEFYGGTVNADHLVLTAIGDDSLDYTDGWTGTVTEVAIQHYAAQESDQGMEMDNADEGNATPRSNPSISNVTIIGSDTSDIGMLIRAGTAATYNNVAITGMGDGCIDIDDEATWDQVDAGNVTLSNAIVDCETNFIDGEVDDDGNPVDEGTSVEDWYNAGSNNVEGTLTPAGDNGWLMTNADGDTVGAFSGGTDWTAGWTIYELN
ncbi:MAG: hypothetical protein AAFV53_19660 [Myxococcota bacterium]